MHATVEAAIIVLFQILNYENPLPLRQKEITNLKKGRFWFCFKCVSDLFFTIIESPYIYGMNSIVTSFIRYIGILVNPVNT